MDKSDFVEKENINASKMNGYTRAGPISNQSTAVELNFRIRENNMDKVKEFVDDTSNPKSKNYGKHMTKAELNELTGNAAGKQQLQDFLESVGASVVKETSSSITATAPVSVWNDALDADFAVYANEKLQDEVIRTPSYSLPSDLAKEVTMVLGTVQFPAPIHGGPVRGPKIN
jgi:tripeptidyl-peptidase-1